MKVVPEQSEPTTAVTLDLRTPLRRYFGFDAFRTGQEDVVRRAIAGRDTLAIMPTGSGKSLCYQLAAMLRPTPTLVISPLIALMKDQVDKLPTDIQAQATFINSSLDQDAVGERLRGLSQGRYRLLYCAPERLRQRTFVAALQATRIGLVVIDEVHCVSMWGHDFRPDYLFLRSALEMLGNPPLLGMTATATRDTERDIASSLGRSPDVVRASVERENLRYEVVHVENDDERMREVVRNIRALEGTGIVYARSRVQCQKLAYALQHSGVAASFYHAGLDTADRTAAQEEFLQGRRRVIVATVAFGMGIDKPDIRWVILYNFPKSLEEYVQMVGRAGRDGMPSRCILYASERDAQNLHRFARSGIPTKAQLRAVFAAVQSRLIGGWAEVSADELGLAAGLDAEEDDARVLVGMLERAGLVRRDFDAGRSMRIEKLPNPSDSAQRVDELLRRYVQEAKERAIHMIAFANERRCRHLQVAGHFGETTPVPCHRCDVCDGSKESKRSSAEVHPLPANIARTIVDGVDSLRRPIGVSSLIATLRGMPDAPPSAQQSPAFGALESAGAKHVKGWVDELIERGHLETYDSDGYRLVRVARREDLPTFSAPKSRSLLGIPLGRRDEPTPSNKRDASFGGERSEENRDEAALYERLRTWRYDRARVDGVPVFIVMHDKVLRSIAFERPTSLEALEVMDGIGPAKLERYGNEIVNVVRQDR